MMKPCIVIVIDLLSKHTPLPRTLDLHFMLLCLCQMLRRDVEENTKVCFSLVMVARLMKPSIVIVLDMLYKHTP